MAYILNIRFISFTFDFNMANLLSKKNVKNCRPDLLLPVFRKIFERLIYNEMYSFFIENDLISPDQLDFKQGDPYIN